MTGVMVVVFFVSWDRYVKGRSAGPKRPTAEQSDTAPVGKIGENNKAMTPGRKSLLRPLLALLLVTVGLATWLFAKEIHPRRPQTLPTPIVNEEYGFRLVLAPGWSAMAPALVAPGSNTFKMGVNIDADINGFLDVVLASTSLDELMATVRGHLDLSDPTSEAPRQVSFRGQRAVEYSNVRSNARGGHSRFRSLMFLRGPYLYTLAAGGDPDALTAARAQSFFEAFQFTELTAPSPTTAPQSVVVADYGFKLSLRGPNWKLMAANELTRHDRAARAGAYLEPSHSFGIVSVEELHGTTLKAYVTTIGRRLDQTNTFTELPRSTTFRGMPAFEYAAPLESAQIGTLFRSTVFVRGSRLYQIVTAGTSESLTRNVSSEFVDAVELVD